MNPSRCHFKVPGPISVILLYSTQARLSLPPTQNCSDSCFHLCILFDPLSEGPGNWAAAARVFSSSSSLPTTTLYKFLSPRPMWQNWNKITGTGIFSPLPILGCWGKLLHPLLPNSGMHRVVGGDHQGHVVFYESLFWVDWLMRNCTCAWKDGCMLVFQTWALSGRRMRQSSSRCSETNIIGGLAI